MRWLWIPALLVACALLLPHDAHSQDDDPPLGA